MSRSPGATVGGQAVIEGVMMRAPSKWAVAVRRPDGVIEARRHDLPRLSARSRLARIPFVRGVMVLGESLTLGFRALTWSARKASEEEGEEELKSSHLVVAMLGALVVFVGVFMLLPLLAAKGAERLFGESTIVFNVVDGVVRVVLFVGYIWAIGRSAEIKRVFEFHGAEHKTIHAYEAGDPLTLDAIQKYSPRHPRCGTNFLLIVILVAIVVFTFVGRPSLVWLVASRVFLIPVIAGISYELLKAAADRRWMAAVSRPGIWLQRLTTAEPDADQVEVAVASLLAALDDGERVAVEGRGPVLPGALAFEVT
ncbi:MAG: DUF1385 domain-containing protein [Acidimicrobiia bacterium]|nr:MAG: DUF1385 domain-containing protein [Acidimicrobiia bacterium]